MMVLDSGGSEEIRYSRGSLSLGASDMAFSLSLYTSEQNQNNGTKTIIPAPLPGGIVLYHRAIPSSAIWTKTGQRSGSGPKVRIHGGERYENRSCGEWAASRIGRKDGGICLLSLRSGVQLLCSVECRALGCRMRSNGEGEVGDLPNAGVEVSFVCGRTVVSMVVVVVVGRTSWLGSKVILSEKGEWACKNVLP